MACYRRAKAALDAFRSLSSKRVPKSPIQESFSRYYTNGSANSGKFSLGFYSYSCISQKLRRNSCCNPNFNTHRRFYIDRNNVQHFRPREPRKLLRSVLVRVFLVSGFLIAFDFVSIEIVPYSNRAHLLLIPKHVDRKEGERRFEQYKAVNQENILPAIHPDSVRVRSIAKNIIEALERGLKHEKGQWKWLQPSTSHLDGLNWEVLVLNMPSHDASAYPGGKIVFSTGFLEDFGTDVEIATIIGHEVAHVVARHLAERNTRNLPFLIQQLILNRVFMRDVVEPMPNPSLRHKVEMEADYIGLLLVASAGYDPRLVPKIYEKDGEILEKYLLEKFGQIPDYDHSTHPSGKRRAQLLAQPKIMEEALTMYKKINMEESGEA